MGSKLKPGKFDCYANAEPDEPMFILLGRDAWAAHSVEHWALGRALSIEAGKKPLTDIAMVEEALSCAGAMRLYRLSLKKDGPKAHLKGWASSGEDARKAQEIITRLCGKKEGRG